ncbi:MAG: hypothetical protein ACYC7D_12860 [Nitrososphaerales archaeon]
MTRDRVLLFSIAVLLIFTLSSSYASAASSGDFSAANSAISSAFVATLNAEKSGGNVSSLTAQLNGALALVQRAHSENATQSVIDLQNATRIANLVSSEAPSVAQSGASSVQVRNAESIGGAAAIVVIAALIYIYGGRIYRRGWLYMYRNYVVKPASG